MVAARIGGPPSTGSPRPLQTRPSQPGPTGIRSGCRRTRPGCSPCPAARCPRAPARRPGRGPPPAPARAARALAASPAAHRGELVPADAGRAADHQQRPRSSATPRGRPRRSRLRSRQPGPGRSSRPAPGCAASGPGAAHLGDAVGRGLLARRAGRRRSRAPRSRRPAPRGPPGRRRRRRRRARRRRARRSCRPCCGRRWVEGALLEHTLAQQPPGEQHHPLCARAATRRRRARRGPQPVRLGEQRRHPRPPRPPARVAVAGVPDRERVGVAGERAGPGHGGVVPGVRQVAVQGPQPPDEPLGVRRDRLGHVAARRRDGADDRHRALGAAQGDAPARPARRTRPAPRPGRRGSPPRPAAHPRARRARAAPRPSATWSRRSPRRGSPCRGSARRP